MTEVNITPEQGSDTAAHIDEMVAKAEGKETPKATPEATSERPAWLPEKFATPEDMAKAYAEAEKKLGGGKETPEAKPEATPEGGTKEVQEAANKAVEGAGLNMDELGQKIVDKGDLDAADYEALAKQGISKDMVQSYVAGQQALGERLVSNMHQTVGGEEAFNNLLGWGAENMSPDEVNAFNATIDSGSEVQIQMALQGLNARFRAEGGATPNLVAGKRGGAATGEVFRSTAEVTKAMSDPRYSRDAAYRADVMAKLSRSNVM